jgi:hypothetical protein
MSTVADTPHEEPAAIDSDPAAAEPEVLIVDPDSVEPVERRQHERLHTYLRVRWEGLFGCHGGTVSDISAGGCFILSERQMTLRELIRLEIELHDGEWVKVWGEVTNQFPGVGFGMRYTEVDGEDEDKFTLSLEQTKSLKAGVSALKRVNRLFLGPDGEDVPAAQVDRQEYKAKLMLALHKVNKALLDLPECRKKAALRLSVQAYADLYRVWSVMSEGAGGGNPRELVEAYRCLKERYAAPAHVLESLRGGDLSAVLTFLRRKASISLAFAS